MAKTNRKAEEAVIYTHGGGRAVPISPKQQLERSVMSCLLWEKEFYEDGTTIASRIQELVKQCSATEVADIAIRAKRDMRLRHVPLFLTRELMRTKEGRGQLEHVIPKVIVRVDDITELLAMYFADNKKGRAPAKLPNQLKKHLGLVWSKFDEYQFGKYRGDGKAVRLKDALRLTHPTPENEKRSGVYKRILTDSLQTPDTWEVAISAAQGSAAKCAEWTRLIKAEKLGGLAVLRNIRNMTKDGVDAKLIWQAITNISAGRLLPINFIAAAKHNPQYEAAIEEKFLQCFIDKPKLKGKTIFVVDTSGSMKTSLSSKSELLRLEAAGGLAAIAREMCEQPIIYCTAGDDGRRKHATMQIPARRGFALVDYIKGAEVCSKIGWGGIFIVQCLDHIKAEQKDADRIIVITDEQDCDTSGKSPEKADTFGKYNYLINVASARNGIGYRNKWVHVDGWSDSVLDFLTSYENNNSL